MLSISRRLVHNNSTILHNMENGYILNVTDVLRFPNVKAWDITDYNFLYLF